MRRKVTVGLTLAAFFALGALAAFADDDVVSPRANMGPRLAQKMVARRDVGTSSYNKPGAPSKPIPGIDSLAGSGRSVSGHSGVGDAIATASISPEMALENSLKSLAKELR